MKVINPVLVAKNFIMRDKQNFFEKYEGPISWIGMVLSLVALLLLLVQLEKINREDPKANTIHISIESK